MYDAAGNFGQITPPTPRPFQPPQAAPGDPGIPSQSPFTPRMGQEPVWKNWQSKFTNQKNIPHGGTYLTGESGDQAFLTPEVLHHSYQGPIRWKRQGMSGPESIYYTHPGDPGDPREIYKWRSIRGRGGHGQATGFDIGGFDMGAGTNRGGLQE